MDKPISERTRLEMAAGAKAVKLAIREAWALKLTQKYQRLAPNNGVTCWVTGGGEMLRVEVVELPKGTVLFNREEPAEGFPIDEIAAQIMLVAGK